MQISKEIISNYNGKLSILSPREWDVLCLLNQGMKVSEISLRLAIKSNTVSTIKKNIYSKLNINSVIELYKLLLSEGLIII
jgi:two-component system invasion response regulator UvrY